MLWRLSNRADPEARAIADRHYNRQKVGSSQFVPPGSCVVLLHDGPDGQALWVTSAPIPKYVKHAWSDCWVNSLFRNESGTLGQDLIRDAMAVTRYLYGRYTRRGMITFIDPKKTKVIKRRGKRIYGYAYMKVGFEHVGHTVADNLAAMKIPVLAMPTPAPPRPPIRGLRTKWAQKLRQDHQLEIFV